MSLAQNVLSILLPSSCTLYLSSLSSNSLLIARPMVAFCMPSNVTPNFLISSRFIVSQELSSSVQVFPPKPPVQTHPQKSFEATFSPPFAHGFLSLHCRRSSALLFVEVLFSRERERVTSCSGTMTAAAMTSKARMTRRINAQSGRPQTLRPLPFCGANLIVESSPLPFTKSEGLGQVVRAWEPWRLVQ